MSTNPNSNKSNQIRFREYIEKIATGPRQSKDLTEDEARDALTLILNGEISPVRSAIFLIAIRMKRETTEENVGIWRAMNDTTVKHLAKVEKLLQVSEPFDGTKRTPSFGFYAIPIIARLGLPCYGHSAKTLPPKSGITFQEILTHHYEVSSASSIDIDHLEKEGFCFVELNQSHPRLEALRTLREEMVKRSALATFEKMLAPISAEGGSNFLATTYFHKGYEIPMIAAARFSGFKKTIIGNGLESTTLFGVHKRATLFTVSCEGEIKEQTLTVGDKLEKKDANKVHSSLQEFKNERIKLSTLADFGEQALRNGKGPAAPLIAWHAGSIACLCGIFPTFQKGYRAAKEILTNGKAYSGLMNYLERSTRSSKIN